MKQTLLHLSDLHFDHVDREVIEPLVRFAHELRPDHVVVSGDLTQRARRTELRHARAFMDRLPQPVLVVPGNHDIPLYDVLSRVFRSRAGYRRHVSRVTEPLQRSEGCCILGLDTSRAWRLKEGSVNRAQIERVRRSFADVPAGTLKVVVTHHPFDPPPEQPHHRVVGNARAAMRALIDARIDLVLSGHLHLSRASHSAHRFVMEGHSAVLVQAGTATSTRTRGEENSFNVIRAGDGEMTVERRTWSDAERAFTPAAVDVFRRTSTGWARTEPPIIVPS